MPNTMSLITSYTVPSSTTSVSLTSIPQTYTDIQLVYSVRCVESVSGPTMTLSFNGSTANVTSKYVYGEGGNGTTGSGNFTTFLIIPSPSSGSDTANTFGSSEIYIPNYTGSNYKSYSANGNSETNGSYGYSSLVAGLWSDTSAITSMTLSFGYGGTRNFAAGSSFYLYGIKNS